MDQEFKTQMIVLNKGLELFHAGFIHTSNMLEDDRFSMWDKESLITFMKNIPLGELDTSVPDHAKFFSLVPEGPYLYGVDDEKTGALKYKIKKPLLLMDLKDKGEEGDDIQQILQRAWSRPSKGKPKDLPAFMKCFDGWIAYDDDIVPWREIFLFRPWEVMGKGKRYYLNSEDVVEPTRTKGYYHFYPYQFEELRRLRKKLVGCFKVSYMDNKIKLLSSIEKCDTAALKYLEGEKIRY